MKLPRDISGRELAQALARLGYQVEHQTGSHMRLRVVRAQEHHLSIPVHTSLKVGTLNAILKLAGAQVGLARDELLKQLFP